MHAHTLCKGQQFVVVYRNHCLVGSDHVFTVLHSGNNVFPCRMQSTDGFHHGVDGGIVQNIIKTMSDRGVVQFQIPTAEHTDNLHIGTGGDQFIHAFSHCTKAKQTDSHNSILQISFSGQKPLQFQWKQYIIREMKLQ